MENILIIDDAGENFNNIPPDYLDVIMKKYENCMGITHIEKGPNPFFVGMSLTPMINKK